MFPSSSDQWLSILRIGLGFQMIIYCLSLVRDWNQLLGTDQNSFINRNLMEDMVALEAPFVPKLSWLVTLGTHMGLPEQTALSVSWTVLLCAGVLLCLGLFCRSSAIVAWFFYLCSVKSGNLLTYGVDNFATIGLFYLILAPFPDRYALDRKLGKIPIKDRHLHGFFRRLLQLHLSVIYFSSGIAKCLGTGWWNGESMWRALTRPPFNIIPVHTVLSGRALLPILGIAICLLETGYAVFIWLKKTRLVWLIAVVCMHIAIGLTMGLYLFASVMIVLNVAAFGPGLFRPEKRETELATAGLAPANPS